MPVARRGIVVSEERLAPARKHWPLHRLRTRTDATSNVVTGRAVGFAMLSSDIQSSGRGKQIGLGDDPDDRFIGNNDDGVGSSICEYRQQGHRLCLRVSGRRGGQERTYVPFGSRKFAETDSPEQ